ncbi:hypothetical protein TNCT_76001 [Trichonephila clavata]|uniref:Uncharacterized protein n=1 Tax=Trichonephila clavata TaxID=2740835 RepID=A0A8X6GQC0_TRICU|nr:hypothetical protein TNCT_76001 [Trichonephila clavata]
MTDDHGGWYDGLANDPSAEKSATSPPPSIPPLQSPINFSIDKSEKFSAPPIGLFPGANDIAPHSTPQEGRAFPFPPVRQQKTFPPNHSPPSLTILGDKRTRGNVALGKDPRKIF